MKYWPKKLISEGKIHGGKHYLCRRIFQHAPIRWGSFMDGMLGAGSMTYNCPPGKIQSACETNYDRWNVKCVIKDRVQELSRILSTMEYSENTFEFCKNKRGSSAVGVEAAVLYIVVNRMSRGGLGKDFAWSDRLRGGQPGDLNAWTTMLKRLPELSERLQGVLFHHQSYMLGVSDFTYLDPPYHPDCRSGGGGEYLEDEWTHEDHVQLVGSVRESKKCIAISHYPHALYDSLGWRVRDFFLPNHSGQGVTKQLRCERLYMNY